MKIQHVHFKRTALYYTYVKWHIHNKQLTDLFKTLKVFSVLNLPDFKTMAKHTESIKVRASLENMTDIVRTECYTAVIQE